MLINLPTPFKSLRVIFHPKMYIDKYFLFQILKKEAQSLHLKKTREIRKVLSKKKEFAHFNPNSQHHQR